MQGIPCPWQTGHGVVLQQDQDMGSKSFFAQCTAFRHLCLCFPPAFWDLWASAPLFIAAWATHSWQKHHSKQYLLLSCWHFPLPMCFIFLSQTACHLWHKGGSLNEETEETNTFLCKGPLVLKAGSPWSTDLQRPGMSHRRVPYVHRRQGAHTVTLAEDVTQGRWSPQAL